MAISDLLASTTSNVAISTGVTNTFSTYIGLGLVDKVAIPKIGGSYTKLDAEQVVVSAATLPAIIKDLAIQNRAIFFGAGTLSGTKGMPTEMTQSQAFGLDIEARATGEVGQTYELTFKDFYGNVEEFNKLRTNMYEKDLYFFTNNTVEIAYWNENNIQFHAIGHEKSGDSTQVVNGKMSITLRSIGGELVPYKGVTRASLANDLKFDINDGDLVNLTKGICSDKYSLFTQTTTATLSSVQFSVKAALAGYANVVLSCGQWEVFKEVGGELLPSTGANDAKVSQDGLFTVPSTHVIGTTNYVVTYKNSVGVYGAEYVKIVTV